MGWTGSAIYQVAQNAIVRIKFHPYFYNPFINEKFVKDFLLYYFTTLDTYCDTPMKYYTLWHKAKSTKMILENKMAENWS